MFDNVYLRKGPNTPKLVLKFVGDSKPVKDCVTKFGGQPNWREAPAWPLSPSTGKKMRFNFQILLDERLFPGNGGKMAYVFISDAGEFWEITQLNSRETAVVIQPNITPDQSIQIVSEAVGPTLREMDEFNEYTVDTDLRFDSSKRLNVEEFYNELAVHQIGGLPVFHKGHEIELDDSWRLLAMLHCDELPFTLRGYGPTYYVFINRDCTRGLLTAYNN